MPTYGKWDSHESNEEAFEKVSRGEWTLERFGEWVSRVQLEEYRNATANEDM